MQKYPEGHFVNKWMGIGIAVFAGVGIPISIISDNTAFIGIGPALGIAIGLSTGQSIENRYKKEGRIRPLNAQEKRLKKRSVMAASILLGLGVAALLIFFLLAT